MTIAKTVSMSLATFVASLTLAADAGASTESDEAAPASNSNTAPAETNWLHVSVGGGVAPILFFPKQGSGQPYAAFGFLPELRLSVSLKPDDKWRLFASARWSTLSKATALDTPMAIQPAENLSKVPALAAVGFAVRPTRGEPSSQAVATGVTRISFQVGYGNLPLDNGVLARGWALMISFDAEGLSFNF